MISGGCYCIPCDSSKDLQELAGISFVVPFVESLMVVDEYRNNRALQ
ncbi:MAG: hypothetical protein V7K48_29110 [Nostoc sp.]